MRERQICRSWPETLNWIERVWKIVPQRHKYNSQFSHYHAEYLDWDRSASGFEGILAQEVLPLINDDLTSTPFSVLAVGSTHAKTADIANRSIPRICRTRPSLTCSKT